MFKNFLSALDTTGGHLFILMIGVGIGIALMQLGVPEGRTILVGAGGALLARLRT